MSNRIAILTDERSRLYLCRAGINEFKLFRSCLLKCFFFHIFPSNVFFYFPVLPQVQLCRCIFFPLSDIMDLHQSSAMCIIMPGHIPVVCNESSEPHTSHYSRNMGQFAETQFAQFGKLSLGFGELGFGKLGFGKLGFGKLGVYPIPVDQ